MSLAVYYLSLLPALREAARGCGYALAIHGSLARDFDLVAVPWVSGAAPPEGLVEAVRAACRGHIAPRADGLPWPREKPHGRRAWSVQLGGGAYLELSVMPRTATVPPDEIPVATRDFARRHPEGAAGLTVAQPFLLPEDRDMNFPASSVQDLVAWLRGQGQHDTATLLQDCLDLASWGVGTFRSQPQARARTQLRAAAPPGHDEEDYADALEGLCRQHSATPQGAAAAPLGLPDWVLPLAVELLQKVLAAA